MAGINPKLEFYRFKLNHKDGYKTFRDYAIDVWNVVRHLVRKNISQGVLRRLCKILILDLI